jgi:L-amino acid N-acyltransferase YncA
MRPTNVEPAHCTGAGSAAQTNLTAAGGRIVVREMRAEDAEQVLAIYQAGLDAGDASFETEAPTWAAFAAGKLPDLRFVAAEVATGEVVGWVAASRVSDRCVYAGVVEHSIYVHPDAHGHGIGAALLSVLIAASEAAGIWTIQSGIFPENVASLALHRRAGFEVVGVRKRLGQYHGRWRDVVFIERRSPFIE